MGKEAETSPVAALSVEYGSTARNGDPKALPVPQVWEGLGLQGTAGDVSLLRLTTGSAGGCYPR